MFLIKAFNNNSSAKSFIEEYFAGNFNSDVISNFIDQRSPSLKARDFTEFLFASSNNMRIQFIANSVATQFISTTIGEYDDIFCDNPNNTVWALRFRDKVIFAPSKRTIIFNGELTTDIIDDAIDFEKAFLNQCIEFALANPTLLSEAHQAVLQQLQQDGIVNNNAVNFDYYTNSNPQKHTNTDTA